MKYYGRSYSYYFVFSERKDCINPRSLALYQAIIREGSIIFWFLIDSSSSAIGMRIFSTTSKNYRRSLSFAGYPVESKERGLPESSLDYLENTQEILLDGRTLVVSKKFLLEAYEKTLEEKLRQVKQVLQSWV